LPSLLWAAATVIFDEEPEAATLLTRFDSSSYCCPLLAWRQIPIPNRVLEVVVLNQQKWSL
jgi:hypothetical protein